MVAFTAFARVNFGNLDLFGAFDESSTVTRDPATEDTTFTVTPNSAQLPDVKAVVKGTGFVYFDENQYPFTGTIKSATLFDTGGSGPDQKLYTIAGLDLAPLEAAGYAGENPFVVAAEIFEGADKITGSRFGDVLCGFEGRDTLKGGAGKDTFLFNADVVSSNVDRVTSFVKADDTIGLDHDVFKLLGASGTLKAANFQDVTDGFQNQDDNDRILYNQDTGKVYYDADGKGGTGPKVFAILVNDPVINHLDFQLV